jgi:hypothetical protein
MTTAISIAKIKRNRVEARRLYPKAPRFFMPLELASRQEDIQQIG